jgi:adenylosuccinate synthase
VLLREVKQLGLGPDQVAISRFARIITDQHKSWERNAELESAIGSTQSGTGAAILAMTGRGAKTLPLLSIQAHQIAELTPFLQDTVSIMRRLLDARRRLIIEGTQGFGLSLLHGGYWPKATSRDTTAAGFLAETGLSPNDVDDVTMVLRSHPIRVAGEQSGPLAGETTWETIAAEAGLPGDHKEYTTVTKKVRRVGQFDEALVKRAIQANSPNRIVLNHLDYIDYSVRGGRITSKALNFVKLVEKRIAKKVNWVGTGPGEIVDQW